MRKLTFLVILICSTIFTVKLQCREPLPLLSAPLELLCRDYEVSDCTKYALLLWRIDSTGCMMVRDILMALRIVKEFDLRSKKLEDFINILGTPQKTYDNELIDSVTDSSGKTLAKKTEAIAIVYYTQAYCDGNNMPAGRGNDLFLKLYFDKETLRYIGE